MTRWVRVTLSARSESPCQQGQGHPVSKVRVTPSARSGSPVSKVRVTLSARSGSPCQQGQGHPVSKVRVTLFSKQAQGVSRVLCSCDDSSRHQKPTELDSGLRARTKAPCDGANRAPLGSVLISELRRLERVLRHRDVSSLKGQNHGDHTGTWIKGSRWCSGCAHTQCTGLAFASRRFVLSLTVERERDRERDNREGRDRETTHQL